MRTWYTQPYKENPSRRASFPLWTTLQCWWESCTTPTQVYTRGLFVGLREGHKRLHGGHKDCCPSWEGLRTWDSGLRRKSINFTSKSIPSREETGAKWYITGNFLKLRFQPNKWHAILTSELGVMDNLLKAVQKLNRHAWTEEDLVNASTSWPSIS
jgi:hypothetical protein